MVAWNIYIYIYRLVVCANAPGELDSNPDQVIPKTQKMVLDVTLLNTQDYKARIKVKKSNARKGLEPAPTP